MQTSHKVFGQKLFSLPTHVINLSPNKVIGLKVALELWKHKTPHYDHLRVFGCSKAGKAELDHKCRKYKFFCYGIDAQFGYCFGILRIIVRGGDV